MEIQWSLVLFTVLTGMGGWTFAFVAVDEFRNKARAAAKPASIVAFALAVAGGIASVTHLSHPDRMLNALNHPTSGIFTEAVLVFVFAALVAIYFIALIKTDNAVVRKVFAVLGAIVGVLLSFMAGYSYMMEAQTTWNTILLPLGYMLTAIPEGTAAYLVVAVAADKEADTGFYGKALVVAGVLGLIGACAFTLSAGAGEVAAAFALAVCGAGLVPIACGVVLLKVPDRALAIAIVALVCAIVGATAYRATMWLAASPIANLFGTVI